MCRQNIWLLYGFVFVAYLIFQDSTCAALSEAACREPTISIPCPHGRKKDLYYYDWSKKTCSTFSYKGCGGNENRFNDKKECETKCGGFSKGISKNSIGVIKKATGIIKKPVVAAKKDETENSKD